MKRGWRRWGALAAALIWAAALCPGRAEEARPTREIYTYEDLLTLAEDPAGHYALMADIDLAGKPWQSVDFTGTLEGNGHALLNLEIRDVSAGVETTYDGNYKEYDTRFAGFFGTLKDAEVTGLRLVNVKTQVSCDQPCFIGGLAGYSRDSLVRDCQVQGRLELTAHDRMFGVGGLVGYGNGRIEDSRAEVTMVCTDTDAENRDEQFMGGACGAGHVELVGCQVELDGYISDHGYVHSGGLVGMYIFYPRGLDYHGEITDNTVTGQITFFEDNTNRRAYCDGFIGEIMNWDFTNGRNDTGAFVRNEVFDYSQDLKPDLCADATYTETVVEPGCDTFGYTQIQCDGCGYVYKDHYTLYRHTVDNWQVTREPTTQQEGLREGTCALCGAPQAETLAKLELPAEPPSPSPAPQDEAQSGETSGERGNALLLGGVAALAVVLVAGVFLASRGRGEGDA